MNPPYRDAVARSKKAVGGRNRAQFDDDDEDEEGKGRRAGRSVGRKWWVAPVRRCLSMLCSSAVSLLRMLCLRNSGCMCVCVCLRETMRRGGALRDYSRVGCFQFLFCFLALIELVVSCFLVLIKKRKLFGARQRVSRKADLVCR